MKYILIPLIVFIWTTINVGLAMYGMKRYLESKEKVSVIKIFPIDCNGCNFFHSYDMSVDDITNICKLTGMQVDDCDIDYQKRVCPAGFEKEGDK